MILFFLIPLIRKASRWAFFSMLSEHRAQRSVWEPLSPPIQAHHLFASVHYFWSRYSLRGGNDFGKQCLLLLGPYRQWHIKEISKQKREKASVSPEQKKTLQFFSFHAWKEACYALLVHLVQNWLDVWGTAMSWAVLSDRGKTPPPHNNDPILQP